MKYTSTVNLRYYIGYSLVSNSIFVYDNIINKANSMKIDISEAEIKHVAGKTLEGDEEYITIDVLSDQKI